MTRRLKADVQALVGDFARLQTQILDALNALHPTIRNTLNFQWPRRVDLSIDDVSWHGVLHGVGYRFEAVDGRVVEAHDGVQVPPYPVDAYRLAEYAESLGIELLAIDNVTFAADDVSAFERCLPLLEQLGRIRLDHRPKSGGLKRYVVASSGP